MSEQDRTLLDLEQRMLDADAAYDESFFEEYCAEDFVAMGGYGVVPRQQVIEMYAKGTANPDRRSRVGDPAVKPLGEDGAVVVYRLTSTTGGETSSWHASTVYRRTPDGWRVVLIHQTPV